MKHHLSLLLVTLLAIGGPLAFAAESHSSPSLEKIITEAKAAFDLVRDLNHASETDPVTIAIEAGPVELAFLPVEPAPARIEKASCRVPLIATASGYLRHAWTDPNHSRVSVPVNRSIAIDSHILGKRLRTC